VEEGVARRFAVNRHTVRKAISDLVDRGYLIVEQGRGTFVCEDIIDYQVDRRTRFADNLRRNDQTFESQLLEVSTIAAQRALANALEIPVDSDVLVLHVRRWAEGRPLSHGRHHFPAGRFADLPRRYAESGSISASLAALGCADYERRETRVSASLAGAEDMELLQIQRGRPVVVSEAFNVDMDGVVIEYGVGRFAGDRTRFVFET